MRFVVLVCALLSCHCGSDVLWSSGEGDTWPTYEAKVAADVWNLHAADARFVVVADCSTSQGAGWFGGDAMPTVTYAAAADSGAEFGAVAVSDERYAPGVTYDAWAVTKFLTQATKECEMSVALVLGDDMYKLSQPDPVDLRGEHITTLRRVVQGFGYDAERHVVGVRGGWELRAD